AFDIQRPEPGFGHARNADRREHGPARYRDALGSSFNLAALDVVTRRVGTAALTERLARMHVVAPDARTDRPSMGLAAAEARLVGLAAAFAVFARGGSFRRGHVLADDAGPAEPAFSPEVAWLVADMLSDREARRPVFGEDLPFDLPFAVLAKTGTS